jgi:putative addiction module killer protein
MYRIVQTETCLHWERSLKDRKTRQIIAARLFRVANGLLGDVYPVGNGISELRIHYGPGYRIYFKQHGEQMVILLCGGNKSTQKIDVQRAIEIAGQLEEDLQ